MEAIAGSLDTQKEATADSEAEVRRWLLELSLADKRERDWRKNAKGIFDRYRGVGRKKNSFNILWANTEVLRPGLYNSTPKPDVRRRFRDADPLGKAVSEVLERGLLFAVDDPDFDGALKFAVLDMLLPGRGISRVRYIPSIKETEDLKPAEEPAEAAPADSGTEESAEELEYEQVSLEHVNWEDYRQGPGKTWPEVPWVAYRHTLKKDDVEERFGEDVADAIVYDQMAEIEGDKSTYSDIEGAFRTAEFWEIWDKIGDKVLFVQKGYKESPIYPLDTPDGEPPLKLKGFFPQPEPLRAIEDSSSQLPTPLYDEYREQAEELDRLSGRINKLINGLKLRGIYDATLTELADLMKGEDNQMIAVTNAAKWAEKGFDRAIQWMPVDMAAKVLFELYKARDQAKEVIYEITGIADIMRGATEASETLGAQQLKAKFASVRIQRMQREVQRYARDIIRIMGEVIGECFHVETLAQMTGLNFPTQAQQVQARELMTKIQAAMQMGQQTGQQPQIDPKQIQAAQAMLQMPTWEQIKAVLASDISRQYRVDIETDSTVAESLQNDMQGLQEVLTGLVNFWTGVGPAVQQGALSIDAVKSISLQVARRSRLGLEVEDAIEQGLQEPKPQNDPKAAAEQQKAQLAQQQAQHDSAIDQRQQVHEQQIAQREQAQAEAKANYEAQLEQQRIAYEARLAEQATSREDALKRYEIDESNKTKIRVAEIQKEAAVSKAADAAQQPTAPATTADSAAKPHVPDIHIHLPSGKKTITTPDGRQYTSEDAPVQ